MRTTGDLVGALAITFVSTVTLSASDHADPIDPLNRQRQEGGITDLFVFPVLKDGSPAVSFQRTKNLPLHDTLADVVRDQLNEEERAQIESLAFILCVRRQLTDSGQLDLEPYTYKIHIDYNSAVEFPNGTDVEAVAASAETMSEQFADEMGHSHHANNLSPIEAFARYGGKISHPDEIRAEINIEFRLTNEGHLQADFPRLRDPAGKPIANGARLDLLSSSGIYDDPFIFPAFFGTNVVAMLVRVPLSFFPSDRSDFLIWATSHKGSRQLDHMGRSLRTQNPRFELLNTLHPSEHVAAITRAHVHPGLMRDILLRLNFGSMFAYRKWDFVPDVMCYSTRYQAGFPNGRHLTDDVAAILAQHGDTLLYELSYQDNNYRWPRQKANDGHADGSKSFLEQPPYLLAPHPNRAQPPARRLSTASIVKLITIGVAFVLFWFFTHWLFARWYYRRKLRRRYL